MSIYDLATLADQLAERYPTIDDSRRILTQSGFNAIEVEYSQRPRDNWWNILQITAYKRGSLRSLLELVIKDHPENQLIRVLLNEVIELDEKSDDRSGVAGPRDIFFHGEQGEKESRRAGMEWFRNMIDLSHAVGLIKSGKFSASAILLPDGYVLTAYQEITTNDIPTLELLHHVDVDSQQINRVQKLDLDTNFIKSNKELNYTLLKRAGQADNKLFMPLTGWDGEENEEVNIISYPMDFEMRISGGIIVGSRGHELFYTSETNDDPAGSPIIYNQHMIGIHGGIKEFVKEENLYLKFAVKIEDILENAGLPLEL